MQSDQERQHLYRVTEHTRHRAEFLGRQVAAQLQQLATHRNRLRVSMDDLRKTHVEFRRRCGWVDDHRSRALTKLLVRLTVAPA